MNCSILRLLLTMAINIYALSPALSQAQGGSTVKNGDSAEVDAALLEMTGKNPKPEPAAYIAQKQKILDDIIADPAVAAGLVRDFLFSHKITYNPGLGPNIIQSQDHWDFDYIHDLNPAPGPACPWLRPEEGRDFVERNRKRMYDHLSAEGIRLTPRSECKVGNESMGFSTLQGTEDRPTLNAEICVDKARVIETTPLTFFRERIAGLLFHEKLRQFGFDDSSHRLALCGALVSLNTHVFAHHLNDPVPVYTLSQGFKLPKDKKGNIATAEPVGYAMRFGNFLVDTLATCKAQIEVKLSLFNGNAFEAGDYFKNPSLIWDVDWKYNHSPGAIFRIQAKASDFQPKKGFIPSFSDERRPDWMRYKWLYPEIVVDVKNKPRKGQAFDAQACAIKVNGVADSFYQNGERTHVQFVIVTPNKIQTVNSLLQRRIE